MTDTPETKIKNQKTESGVPPLPYSLPTMVESLLFVASEPVPVLQLAEALDIKVADVEQALTELNAAIVARGIRVQRKGDRVQLTTQPECAPYVEKFLGLDLTTRLSKPALETLAIIAYQQPVTRAQIEHVRGVNCDGVLSTLLNRGLIEEVGRLETAGRPIQYGTTFAFLQHFGLRSLDDMPMLQAEEAAALEALAEQGQAIEVDLAAPAVHPENPATPAVEVAPEQPATPVETQLPLINEATPKHDRADADAVVEQAEGGDGGAPALADVIAEQEVMNAEAPEAERETDDPAVDSTPELSEEAIEPPSSEETDPNENAAS